MEIPADKKTRLITLLIGAVQAAGLLVAQLLLIALFWTGQGGPVSQIAKIPLLFIVFLGMAYFAISSVLRLWVNWNRFSWGAYIFGCLITVFTIALTQPPKYTVLSLLPLAVLLAAVIDYFNFSVTSSLPIEVDQEKQQIKCVQIQMAEAN